MLQTYLSRNRPWRKFTVTAPLDDSDRVAKVANDGLEVALAPTQHLPVELQSRLKTASSAVVPYIRRGPERVERVVRVIQRVSYVSSLNCRCLWYAADNSIYLNPRTSSPPH